MFKMTVLWLLIYFGSWLASFVNPLFGLLGYLFEYYLRPSLHWWGRGLPDLRWNMAVAAVLAITFLMKRESLTELKPVPNPALKWILGLMVLMLFVTPIAANMEQSWDKAVMFQKSVLIYLLIIGVVRTVSAFDAVIAVHMAGAGWWGWEQYLDPKREQSRLLNVGSSDTLNDNLASAHLLTVLPFIFIYLLTVKDKKMRGLALITMPFVVNLLILCNSRGAMLGMLTSVLAALFLAKSGHRLRMVAALPVLAGAFLFLADPEFIARQQTTADYEEQGTAVERMNSWAGGLNLIKDHPFGAGGDGYELLSPKYIPDIVAAHDGAQRAPHNTYVLIASEWGILGLICYVGLIGSTMLMLFKIRRLSTPDDGMFYRALALQLAMIGTLTASTFADRFYGESFYWMCGLAAALYRIQHNLHPESLADFDEVSQDAKAGAGGWRAAVAQ